MEPECTVRAHMSPLSLAKYNQSTSIDLIILRYKNDICIFVSSESVQIYDK